MNDWFRRHAPWLGAALIVVLIGAAYVLRADGSAHAQSAAAPRSAELAASAVSASPSASPASATRRRSFALSAGKSSFRTLAPSSTPGRPGIRTPPPSAGALAQSLRRATGLSPSQVTTRAVCPAVGAGQARCAARALVLRASGALVRPRPGTGRALGRVRSATAAASAAAAAAPDPATPAYLQQAYDLTALSQQAGSGDTVAIVDAYNDPTAESDLGVFRTAYGLPACTKANGCFRKVNQTGGTSSLPAANSDWESEVSLDLDAVSAICPNCHILLVEANSSNLTDLVASMQTASSMGANQISDSWWGSSRVSGRYTFPGVATVAATGDNGYVPSGAAYPAAYPGVTAAGGTSLASATSNVRGFGEQAWSGGGSGCNGVYPRPSYQPNIGCSGRVFADLSADADPDTGLKIYTPGGWAIYGGTSLAAPLIAAYYAITGVSATTPQWAYSDSGLLNDVVTGSNGTCSNAALCNGEIGYDGPTGVGSISGTVATGAPGVAGPAYTSGTQNTYTQSVGSQGATVGGGIYRNGLDTTWWIEYGTSQAYGSVTSPVDIGAGTAPIAVTGSLTGLTPGTLYHYRLVAKNALGTTYGYDYTLTTAPATAPSAAFTVSPSVPTPSAPVSFDASGSVAGTGGTISHYSWDFGDGTQHTGTTPTDSHQYATRGNYTVTLTITNSRGQTSTTTQAVAVDNPPTAAVTPSTTFTAPATSVSFNASGSSAGAGGTIKDYSWGFGDGTAKDSGPTASTTHAFASPGVYTVTLTVTDDLNVANSTTAVITVDQPNASFTATPATVAPGGTVSFDATGSTDPHDTITDYRWNFGDGTSQDTGTTPTASHPYTNRGNWTVTLTITNSHNQTSSSTQTVTADTPPTAAVTPSTGWTGPATPVTFDASGSRAGPGGTIKDYGWDFGDGTAIEHTGTTSSATHAFASPGVYTVKLTATDDLHVANSTTAVITVDQPNASFTATPATVAPGGTISFDGTGSTDPHDTISDYTWNFGDGTRLDTLSTPTTSHPYVNRGHYAVSLTVTSSHNQTSTTTQTVTADNPPIPTFTASATTMTAGSPVTFNGSASTAGSISDYTWNFGDGTSRDTGSTSSTAYTFASAGTYTVMLTTTDDLGVSATATRQFTVQAPVAATSTPPTTPASSTPAPTPAPTTAPTPAPSPSPSPTLTGALTATQKQRLAFVLAHGVRISVSSSASASIRFQITVPRAAFKSAATGRKSKGAPIVLLRTGGQTLPAGTHAFSLKLPAWVRHKLSTTRRLVLTVQVTLTAGGHTINRSLKITLAR